LRGAGSGGNDLTEINDSRGKSRRGNGDAVARKTDSERRGTGCVGSERERAGTRPGGSRSEDDGVIATRTSSKQNGGQSAVGGRRGSQLEVAGERFGNVGAGTRT